MRCGVNEKDGSLLYGWAHCCQSLRKCLTTKIGTRVLRRHYGCDVGAFQDANADPATILQLYQAIVQALNDPECGEPGFSLQKIDLIKATREGTFHFVLTGVFYPDGHLGDWSHKEPISFDLEVGDDRI
ncbi:GPW/gp25 family protein [Bartonella machadoae]|uniref:GPW/gp25 family protein n=1 Tax=Bartonella machadoae TaxID=2893471 RepID=UPI001F4CE469|nr:baseplate assembly protein [Bartonella machadoae]UNE53509.1 baseplate assembly protein [Bartonella machadoae]UNE54171.1 baseplate assembly protein [Bartonella machadoae]